MGFLKRGYKIMSIYPKSKRERWFWFICGLFVGLCVLLLHQRYSITYREPNGFETTSAVDDRYGHADSGQSKIRIKSKQPEMQPKSEQAEIPLESDKLDPTHSEIRHIAFLKVHKAASSTIQNILYRFGFNRNLSFVLPQPGHYLSKSKYVYNPVFPSLYGGTSITNGNQTSFADGKHDILCNHVVFNHKKFSELLFNDTFYFAIVREPLNLFISSAYYYRYVWPDAYLTSIKEETFIEDLILDPRKYEKTVLTSSRTYNYMARDFGYTFNSIDDVENTSDDEFDDFLQAIDKRFNTVLVVEHFVESLVLLKRNLNWSFKDILFMKNNELQVKKKLTTSADLSSTVKDSFKDRNKLDCKLYKFFAKKFDNQILQEVDFDKEVEAFKTVLQRAQAFCTKWNKNKNLYIDTLIVAATDYSGNFNVTALDCYYMMKEELRFFKILKDRHLKFLHDV